jgi:hypothetical protein
LETHLKNDKSKENQLKLVEKILKSLKESLETNEESIKVFSEIFILKIVSF